MPALGNSGVRLSFDLTLSLWFCLIGYCSESHSSSHPMQERLEREYNLDLVTTAPTVVYKCMTSDRAELTVNSPGDLPEATKRESISEPYVR